MSDLDYEAATLAIREWTLWVAAASLVVSAVIGGLQCFLIWRGLVIMRRAADTRDRALENQRRESDQRHAEAMKAGAERHAEAMKAGAERHAEAMKASADAMKTGAERHAEAMKASADAMKAGAERHAENMAALDAIAATLAQNTETLAEATGALKAQSRALEALIERTAPETAG